MRSIPRHDVVRNGQAAPPRKRATPAPGPRLLRHLPEPSRQSVHDRFHGAVRRGFNDPVSIVAFVVADCRSRIGWFHDKEALALLAIVTERPIEAVAFADWCLHHAAPAGEPAEVAR